jgi:excisionase family DNA binding protein
MSMESYLTTAEVAAITRAPEGTVRFWRHKGTGPRGVKVGRRVLYRRDDVEAWLSSLDRTPQKSAA